MRLIILGAGGYGQTVEDLAEQLGRYGEICFLDDHAQGSNVLGCCGDFLRFADAVTEFYPAFGNNNIRISWLDRLENQGCGIATLIHPDAYCSPRAVIGKGTVILPKAAINTNARTGRGCILNLGALVDHGTVLGDGVHVCLGAIIKGDNIIPAGMKIEAGEVIERATFHGTAGHGGQLAGDATAL